MTTELLPWELELLQSTRRFVKKCCPRVMPDKREELVARIYSDVRRTLKLYYQRNPGEQGDQ